MLNQAEIPESPEYTEPRSSSSRGRYWPGLFLQPVCSASGRPGRSHPGVGVPAGKIGAQEAAPGISNTHGAVNENLQISSTRSFISLISSRESSRQHNPGDTKLLPERRGPVCGIGLGAEVDWAVPDTFA